MRKVAQKRDWSFSRCLVTNERHRSSFLIHLWTTLPNAMSVENRCVFVTHILIPTQEGYHGPMVNHFVKVVWRRLNLFGEPKTTNQNICQTIKTTKTNCRKSNCRNVNTTSPYHHQHGGKAKVVGATLSSSVCFSRVTQFYFQQLKRHVVL